MKDAIKSFIKSVWKEAILLIFLVSCFVFLFKSITSEKLNMTPVVIKNEGVKLNLSLDRGFLSCVRSQQKCVFENLRRDVQPKVILENCKEIDYCDKKYSRSN